MKVLAIGLMALIALGQSGGDRKTLKGEITAIQAPTKARADKGVLLIVQAVLGDGQMINLEIKKETKIERLGAKDSRVKIEANQLLAGQFFEATYTGMVIATEPEVIENVTSFVINTKD
jgi:hypothetical protein